MVLHIGKDYDSVLEMVFKTEFLTLLSQRYNTATGGTLRVDFNDNINFTVKKVCLSGD